MPSQTRDWNLTFSFWFEFLLYWPLADPPITDPPMDPAISADRSRWELLDPLTVASFTRPALVSVKMRGDEWRESKSKAKSGPNWNCEP